VCGQSLASVHSHTVALLLGIDFQKLSARHKRNRTSRNFEKHLYLKSFLGLRFITDVVMSAVLSFVSLCDDDDDDDDDDDGGGGGGGDILQINH